MPILSVLISDVLFLFSVLMPVLAERGVLRVFRSLGAVLFCDHILVAELQGMLHCNQVAGVQVV